MIGQMSPPNAIKARDTITAVDWYCTAAASGTGEGGAVLGRSQAESEMHDRVESWLNEPLLQLRSLQRLEPGWDSYGARTLSPDAISTALAFLEQVVGRPRPSIVPTAQGGIQLEWHDGRIDVELECLPSGHAQLAAEDSESGVSVERWVMPGHIALDDWLEKLNVTTPRPIP